MKLQKPGVSSSDQLMWGLKRLQLALHAINMLVLGYLRG